MFVRSLALCAAASLSLALAADANSWGGYYIGLNAGQGWSETDTTRAITSNAYFTPANLTAVEAASEMALEEETFAGGGQLGVNWPLSKHVVLGVEADVQGYGNETTGTTTVVYPDSGPATFTVSNSVEQTWLATARLRLGVGNDWFLAYATGGYAGADLKFRQTFSDTFGGGIPLQTIENSDFISGYSIGGGIEVMIESGASIKIEYLHVELDVSADGPIAIGTTTSTGRADISDRFVRVGFNFQMD